MMDDFGLSKWQPKRNYMTSQGQIGIIILTTVILIVISILSIWFFPTKQDFMSGNSLWNGLSDFSKEYDVTALDSLENELVFPQGKVLISIPYRPYGEDDLYEVNSFVTDGGKLILLNDYGYGNEVLDYLGIQSRFSGHILLDPLFAYENFRLPRISDFSQEIEEAGVKSVVFNHATALTDIGPGDIIASSSAQSFLDFDRSEKLDPWELTGPFPVAASFNLGKGEVILISDPSILINSMLEIDDNRAFLEHIIGYNIEPDEILIDRSHLEKSRLDKLKLELGEIQDTFSKPPAAVGLIVIIFSGVSVFWLLSIRRQTQRTDFKPEHMKKEMRWRST